MTPAAFYSMLLGQIYPVTQGRRQRNKPRPTVKTTRHSKPEYFKSSPFDSLRAKSKTKRRSKATLGELNSEAQDMASYQDSPPTKGRHISFTNV
ncbi:uncharacterized protein TrAFT101_000996 [Trichoderma asperellum]|uniref:uncharacterized protein n=1 Tax=Trichoderma asperellum TaxID=101201 RepID=UPI0033167062|nr:hypothetical protein TrAFT101_000996 [Trichoderma asperellum]